MQIKEIKRKKTNIGDPKKTEEMIKELHKEYDKLVKGRFEFIDAQGGWIEFTHRFFKEDLLLTYTFVHGEVCEIPMGIVKHINNTVKKIRSFPTDETGRTLLGDRGVPSTFTTQSRIRFIPESMF